MARIDKMLAHQGQGLLKIIMERNQPFRSELRNKVVEVIAVDDLDIAEPAAPLFHQLVQSEIRTRAVVWRNEGIAAPMQHYGWFAMEIAVRSDLGNAGLDDL